MSTLDVVAEVLREVAPRALSARQVVELAVGRLPTVSRTPETVVSRDLALEVKRNGASSRFLRAAPGEFLLKEALPTAFYNDVEPYAAAWTKSLIAAGEIAPGVVDERSIRDLKPADVASYRQFHAFAGIGVWSRALRDAGWPDDASVFTGSCPCQSFSQAGRRRGFDDERHLWPEWFRLIKECGPGAIFGEQVGSPDGLAWLDLVRAQLEGIGYTVGTVVLPACGFGAPHRRERIYFVALADGERLEGLRVQLRAGQPRSPFVKAGGSGEVGRISGAVSDAAVTRSCDGEDLRADRGDAIKRVETFERGTAGCFEFERGGPDDGASAISVAERVVRDPWRIDRTHGRPEVEPDRHGEADGTVELGDAGSEGSQGGVSGTRGWIGVIPASDVDGRSVELGDAGLARGRRDAGALLGEKGTREAERIFLGDLTYELVATGAAHRFQPGDRVRIVDDPSWGGAVGGYWAEDVEWIYCRPEPGHPHGRWRPARRGIEPLAPRTSPGVGRNRSARLKGTGNSIVRQVAAGFCGVVIEEIVGASPHEAALAQAQGVPHAP